MPEVRREVCAACRIGETHKGTFKCRSKIPVAILPISFLSKDEGMAAALYQRLSEELQVFFGSYPKSVISIPSVAAIWHNSDRWPR
jgi:hypothetical protein